MENTATVGSWSQERFVATQRKLIQIARHAIRNGQPNLLNENEAADVIILVNSLEEHAGDIESGTGLEHLPDMPQDQVDAPDSPPVDETTVSTEGEQTSETGV